MAQLSDRAGQATVRLVVLEPWISLFSPVDAK
jgi:hypothetical protein